MVATFKKENLGLKILNLFINLHAYLFPSCKGRYRGVHSIRMKTVVKTRNFGIRRQEEEDEKPLLELRYAS